MRKKAVKNFFIMTEKVQHCLKMKAKCMQDNKDCVF